MLYVQKMILVFFMLLVIFSAALAENIQFEDIEYSLRNESAIVVGCKGNMKKTLQIPSEVFGIPVVGIGEKAFFNNQDLWAVLLPSTIQYIGRDAFSDSSIHEIILNDGLLSIGEGAFAYSKLTSIYIPHSVKQIDRCAFFECTNLHSVYIDASIDVLNEQMFFECINLYELHLPNSIKAINKEAFYFCHSIEEYNLPEELIIVGEGAFWGTEIQTDYRN